MKFNVGGLDKILRVGVGAGLIGATFVGDLPMWVGLVGVVPLLTGLVGFCPLYPIFGISTCKTKKESE